VGVAVPSAALITARSNASCWSSGASQSGDRAAEYRPGFRSPPPGSTMPSNLATRSGSSAMSPGAPPCRITGSPPARSTASSSVSAAIVPE